MNPYQLSEQHLPFLTRMAALACRFLGVNRLFYFLNRKRKRILAYHNVLPDAHFRNRLHEGVSHSESVFREQITHLTRRFKIGLDIDDPNQLTLSFDDGYRNQHAVAHPILMQFGIKAYFFCTLELVSDAKTLLIDEFMCWLSYAKAGCYRIELPNGTPPLTLIVQNDNDRLACWKLLYPHILADYPTVAPALYAELDRCQPFSEIKQQIDATYRTLRFDPILPHALLTMKAYGHLVGAHGKTHAPLGCLAKPALEEELKTCESEIGNTFNTGVFCFPFGGLKETTSDVRRFGFSHAFANINVPLPKTQSYHDFMIPRLALPNSANPAEMDFILSGTKYFLKHRCLLPKW